MSVYATAWAKRQKTGSPTRKAVLTALADYADEHGKGWPSVGRLSEDTELSVRAVQNAIRELIEAGIISREDRESENGASKSSLYALPINAGKGGVQEMHPRVQEMQGGEGAAGAGGPPQDVHPHYVEPLFRTVKEEKTLSSPKEKSRAGPFPKNFEPSEANKRLAAAKGISGAGALAEVVDHFRDHHVARGNVFKDWHAALGTWLRSPLLHQRSPSSQPNGFYNRPPVDLEAEAAAAYAEIERRKLKNAQCH